MKEIVTLVKKARRGDEKAFTQLFKQYEEVIYRTAYVYLNHPDDALDVVQETAYRSFKSIASLKEPAYFKTWLIRIAITCSIDYLRQRKKVIPLQTEHLEYIRGGEEEDISLSLSLKELIASLDEEEKSVIILRFYQDYTIQQTAELLGIPLGTGKTILYRALKKLRIRSEESEEGHL